MLGRSAVPGAAPLPREKRLMGSIGYPLPTPDADATKKKRGPKAPFGYSQNLSEA